MIKAYSITRFISGVVYTPVAGQTNTLNFVYRYDPNSVFQATPSCPSGQDLLGYNDAHTTSVSMDTGAFKPIRI